MDRDDIQIDIVTKDWGILKPEISGLEEAIQTARLVVTIGKESRSHVVVTSAEPPFLLRSSYAALQRVFPVDVISMIRAQADGKITMSCQAKDEAERMGAAAAAATIKRSWAWDDSPSIDVTIEGDDRSVAMNPVFEGASWRVKTNDGA